MAAISSSKLNKLTSEIGKLRTCTSQVHSLIVPLVAAAADAAAIATEAALAAVAAELLTTRVKSNVKS